MVFMSLDLCRLQNCTYFNVRSLGETRRSATKRNETSLKKKNKKKQNKWLIDICREKRELVGKNAPLKARKRVRNIVFFFQGRVPHENINNVSGYRVVGL